MVKPDAVWGSLFHKPSSFSIVQSPGVPYQNKPLGGLAG
jgi:hypothetical protein